MKKRTTGGSRLFSERGKGVARFRQGGREGEKRTLPRGRSPPVVGGGRAFKECRRIGRNHRMLAREGRKDGANLLRGYDGRDDQGLVETRL